MSRHAARASPFCRALCRESLRVGGKGIVISKALGRPETLPRQVVLLRFFVKLLFLPGPRPRAAS
jgi:hypothetical protein